MDRRCSKSGRGENLSKLECNKAGNSADNTEKALSAGRETAKHIGSCVTCLLRCKKIKENNDFSLTLQNESFNGLP
jgi:hypothetical protein